MPCPTMSHVRLSTPNKSTAIAYKQQSLHGSLADESLSYLHRFRDKCSDKFVLETCHLNTGHASSLQCQDLLKVSMVGSLWELGKPKVFSHLGLTEMWVKPH